MHDFTIAVSWFAFLTRGNDTRGLLSSVRSTVIPISFIDMPGNFIQNKELIDEAFESLPTVCPT
jgi:hypothetical protein